MVAASSSCEQLHTETWPLCAEQSPLIVTPNLNFGNYCTGYIVNITIIQGDAVRLPWLVGRIEKVELEKPETTRTYQLFTYQLTLM